MQINLKATVLALGLGSLAACGDTAIEQAVFGAGAGAGTAAILDGNILTGAAVGAAGNLLYCQTEKKRRRC